MVADKGTDGAEENKVTQRERNREIGGQDQFVRINMAFCASAEQEILWESSALCPVMTWSVFDGFRYSIDLRAFVSLGALLLLGCGGPADQFEGNTENGKFEVTVQRVLNAAPARVTEDRWNHQLRYVLPVLARNLPLGAEPYVEVTASEYGIFRYGAGWISGGDLYFGRHGVKTELVDARSSDSGVVSAQVVRDSADQKVAVARLVALRPGVARVTFKAWRLDQNGRRRGSSVEDSMELNVIDDIGNGRGECGHRGRIQKLSRVSGG